jgi:transketolase
MSAHSSPEAAAFSAPRLASAAHDLRRDILAMIAAAGSGHPGGSLSAIDIIAYLYFHRMRIDPVRPAWDDRDRFVLSKGHCAPAWYVALAARGYFPRETLWTLRDIDSPLQGHPDRNKCPGVDMTTGSLGQGFSCAAGIALGGKQQHKDFRVYVMLSDGELQEGVIWEAAMAAAHFRLDNLIAFVDDNGLQTDGRTAEIMNPAPIAQKFAAFGWETLEIDGHDFEQIHHAADWAQTRAGRPHVIVADTVKGKGLPSLEDRVESHSLGGPWSDAELAALLAELEAAAR